MTRPETIEAALSKADAVINLAGAVKLPTPAAYYALHKEAAAGVAQRCHQAGVGTLIHFSALGVSSHAPSVADRSKAAGEAAVREAFPKALIIRPSLLYGPNDHLLTLFSAISRSTPVIPLFGATTRFQPLFVGDLCEAISRLLTAGGCGHPPYLYQAAGPETLTLREIVNRLLTSLERRRLLFEMPDRLALWAASLIQWLPDAPFNRDQVLLMKTDKVALPELPTLQELGIVLQTLDHWLEQQG